MKKKRSKKSLTTVPLWSRLCTQAFLTKSIEIAMKFNILHYQSIKTVKEKWKIYKKTFKNPWQGLQILDT